MSLCELPQDRRNVLTEVTAMGLLPVRALSSAQLARHTPGLSQGAPH